MADSSLNRALAGLAPHFDDQSQRRTGVGPICPANEPTQEPACVAHSPNALPDILHCRLECRLAFQLFPIPRRSRAEHA